MKSASLDSHAVFINNYDHLHFLEENVLEALKKTFKTKVNQNKAVFNLWGVVVYNIVDGPSKLLCHLLPYLKKKKNELIATYAKR